MFLEDMRGLCCSVYAFIFPRKWRVTTLCQFSYACNEDADLRAKLCKASTLWDRPAEMLSDLCLDSLLPQQICGQWGVDVTPSALLVYIGPS